MNRSRVFAGLITGLMGGDREFNLGPFSQLAESDSAQACDVKEEFAAVFTLYEAELAIPVKAADGAAHSYNLPFGLMRPANATLP
jgi:hypothetical protein